MVVLIGILFIFTLFYWAVYDWHNSVKLKNRINNEVIPGSKWYLKTHFRHNNPDLKKEDWSITIERTHNDGFGHKMIDYKTPNSEFISRIHSRRFFIYYTKNKDGREN
jgi:hypothetical protein